MSPDVPTLLYCRLLRSPFPQNARGNVFSVEAHRIPFSDAHLEESLSSVVELEDHATDQECHRLDGLGAGL